MVGVQGCFANVQYSKHFMVAFTMWIVCSLSASHCVSKSYPWYSTEESVVVSKSYIEPNR